MQETLSDIQKNNFIRFFFSNKTVSQSIQKRKKSVTKKENIIRAYESVTKLRIRKRKNNNIEEILCKRTLNTIIKHLGTKKKDINEIYSSKYPQ